ncbi:hypothetical protein BDZ90DRAFT_231036 [Jaminaea rosea]|uniref:Biotin-protein ligase N-terminal domain-containing protein n=1 Tax=Jaminaea rosea TaxID=1569628 RepID=A0A316UUX5_9BASI|nr:hypothetical protein BDZ90DRAFT_231036 [Jaminaea rosea]PWN29032.1 hypothetical protein BDZ90DRAFT_231036 [Jaminaea rosea]
MTRRVATTSPLLLTALLLVSLLLASFATTASAQPTSLSRTETEAMGSLTSRISHHHARQDPNSSRPTAAIYRGPIACEYCAESVGALLSTHPLNFSIRYLGPNESAGDVTAANLKQVDLFVQPGGGDDTDTDWARGAKYFTPALQQYVKEGGNFMGVCLGAFFARGPKTNETYFDLMPEGSYVTSERLLPGAQERSAKDTVVEVDWYFHSGPKRGTLKPRSWQYFQDGGAIVMDMAHAPKGTVVLGRYSYSGRPSAVVYPQGKGWVGLIGTHPEAQIEDNDWYDLGFKNPDGYERDWGDDFVQTFWDAVKKGDQGM